MSSSFFGFNVAQQGLYTARTNMDITNHNISNAETEGYSRQYGIQTATRPMANNTRGMLGTGVEITDVQSYRDEYLDYKYWNTNEDLGKYDVKYDALTQMELIFGEPSDIGFTSYFDDVFTSLSTLSKNPGDTASRVDFINNLESLTTYVTDMSEQFSDLQDEMNFGIKNSVDQINYISEQISVLNQQIGNMELTGNTANDLRDERMRLIDDLSKIVSIDVDFREDVNGFETLDITINGQQLVYGSAAYELEVVQKDYLSNPEDNVDMYDIYWTSGKRLYIENENMSGELRGFLDVRDGNNKDNFQGDIVSGIGTNTLVMENYNRDDLPDGGAITIEGVKYEYTSFTVDSPVAGQMTFNLSSTIDATVTSTTATMGVETEFKGIPYYEQQLNEFVRTLAMEFNELHQKGDPNGTPLLVYDGYTGTPQLDFNDPETYNAITLENFTVNPDIIDDPDLLETRYDNTDGEGNNDLILDMIDLRHDDEMFDTGVPDNFIQAIISEMGIDVKQMTSFKNGQEELSNLIVNQRLSIMDVDLDEEAINLVKYQQAYNMSAKILTVFDEIYDVTINQMGV